MAGEGMEELLKDSDQDDTLRRQVRGVINAVAKIKEIKDSTAAVSHSKPRPLNTAAPPPPATAGNVTHAHDKQCHSHEEWGRTHLPYLGLGGQTT